MTTINLTGTITLKIDDNIKINLTLEQAKELQNKLDELFNNYKDETTSVPWIDNPQCPQHPDYPKITYFGEYTITSL